MQQKIQLRKKYLNFRKKNYYDIDKKIFSPLIKLIRSKFKKKFLNIALYYPSNFELNVLKILEINNISAQNILLPKIYKNSLMHFFPWKKNDVLFVNNYGILKFRDRSLQLAKRYGKRFTPPKLLNEMAETRKVFNSL